MAKFKGNIFEKTAVKSTVKKPKAAEKIPITISNRFLKLRFWEITNCRYSFASSYSDGFLLSLNFREVLIIKLAINDFILMVRFFRSQTALLFCFIKWLSNKISK